MPWGIEDVEKHRKGLSTVQKKKWLVIANSSYKTCMSENKDDKECAARAIRIANSKFENQGSRIKK